MENKNQIADRLKELISVGVKVEFSTAVPNSTPQPVPDPIPGGDDPVLFPDKIVINSNDTEQEWLDIISQAEAAYEAWVKWSNQDFAFIRREIEEHKKDLVIRDFVHERMRKTRRP